MKAIKCVNCGFLSIRPGGYEGSGSYLKNEFSECHFSTREKIEANKYSIPFNDDGDQWDVVSCFHRVWYVMGGSKDDDKKATDIVNKSRQCPYFFPYHSGYEPLAHNELKRDKRTQTVLFNVGLINGIAVILAALITVLLRG